MIKRLEMQGFKSFNKSISIPLSNGVTSIVGPNGSGKSNVVDSLCFVLGRTSAKSMRADRLTHLIYNGGKGNKPSKFMEVSLVLDNAKRNLPYDEEEVLITRRITQKGTVGYKINQKRCTRENVLELLSSISIEPEGYNIVLQGDVTNLIEMGPSERRQIIDDISGVSDYNEKKERAKKDLDEVEKRIKELIIVMSERKKHLTGLKKEKEDAENYQALKNEFEETQARLAFTQLKNIESKVEKLQEKLEEEEGKLSEIQKEIDTLRSEIEKKEETLRELDKKLLVDGNKEQLHLRNEVERISNQVSLNKSKIESKQSEISRTDTMITKLQRDTGEKSAYLVSMLKGAVKGVHGAVRDLYTTESKYMTAISSAMGPRANYIVVDNEDVAIECVEYLRESKAGRSTFLPLNKIRGPPHEVRSGKGFLGLAKNLVKYDEKFSSIFSFVLGNTYVVQDLRTVKGFIGKTRMASLDGDVSEKSGAVRGGYIKKGKGENKEVEEYIGLRDKLLSEIDELRIDNEKLEKNLELATERADKIGLDLEKSEDERSGTEGELKNMRQRQQELLDEKDKANLRVGDVRVEKARSDAQLTDIQANAKKHDLEGLTPGDMDKLAKRINEINQEIIRLEPVNMKAIELYTEEAEKFRAFEDKFNTLQGERNSVLDFIEDIEGKKKDVFMKVFMSVSEEFERVFPILSPKGEAHLYLENEDDPFTGGLLIEAKPAGKKVLTLEAMSGGEKVMTALSLLFALQKHKPAPFYVFDEVDAALDSKNSLKFVELLKERVRDAQVLVITHNNAIIKKSDRLYGVSMMDDGISNLVGLELGKYEAREATN